MKVFTEVELRNFEFWSGAIYTAEHLTPDELDAIESILEEEYPDGLDETQINDIFWFEEDWIAQLLGYEDFEELAKRDEEKEEDDEEDE